MFNLGKVYSENGTGMDKILSDDYRKDRIKSGILKRQSESRSFNVTEEFAKSATQGSSNIEEAL